MSTRWSEEDYAAYLRRGQPAQPLPLSEATFLATVLRLAKEHGWLAYHTYRSTKSAEGFPDLILVRKQTGQVCYAIELKTDVGQATPAQQAWLTALGQCTGVVAEVWRPAQLSAIAARLRG
jgi:hypothetical protein